MSKKQKCPEFENHERWLISYADMLTLLFAVFVVLYSKNMSSSDKKEEQLAASLREAFNTPFENIPIDRRVGPMEAGFGIFEHLRGDQAHPPLIKKFPGNPQQVKLIDSEMQRVKLQLEERLYGPQKFRGHAKPGQERIANVFRTSDGFRVQLLAQHFFQPGATDVKLGALKDLDTVIETLKDLGRPVTIEGHTDSTPSSGISNWELSALRATNVLKRMVDAHDFPPSLLSVAGYGDLRPIASNNTEAGRALNRRIEILVHYNTETGTDPQ